MPIKEPDGSNDGVKEVESEDIVPNTLTSELDSNANPKENEFAYKEQRALINDKIPVVLVVEDNDELRKYLVEHFENLYNMLEAENGLKGFDIAARELPDLIISDVMMPEMNGLEFCSKIKSDPKTGHIPVILLTAKSTERDRIEGIEMEADEYIVKPFNLDFLTARVKNLLLSRNRLKEKYRHEMALPLLKNVPVSPDDRVLQKMLRYVEEHLANPDLGIDEICAAIGVSRASLYRKVKAMTGLTILELIKEIRLKRAKQLLQNQKFNINDVAYLAGFSESDYFRKCFKAEFGLTPTAYKNMHGDGQKKETSTE